jgi:hypothetical protein
VQACLIVLIVADSFFEAGPLRQKNDSFDAGSSPKIDDGHLQQRIAEDSICHPNSSDRRLVSQVHHSESLKQNGFQRFSPLLLVAFQK